MPCLLYTDVPWTFEYEVAGTLLFQSEITVHLAVEGVYGSREILGWKIEDIMVEGWDSKNRRPTRHYLPMNCDGANLIVSELEKNKSFDAFVREHALAQAEAA